MSYRVIVIAPPTQFPVGFEEFLRVHPQATFEIYHHDYSDLGRYFFAKYIKEIMREYPMIVLNPYCRPDTEKCDLLIDDWPEEKGSVDLREYLEVTPRVERRTSRKTRRLFDDLVTKGFVGNEAAILKNVVDLLMGEHELTTETMRELEIATDSEALEWIEGFCEYHRIKCNVMALHGMLAMNRPWSEIESNLTLVSEK